VAFSDKSQTFPKNPEISLEALAQGIEQFLIQREDMICQILSTPVGLSIQTKKKEDWKKYVLLDNAMQIDLTETDQFLTVQIGGAKWVAKGAAMGVGMIVAWPIGIPLMALSSIGGFGTMNMPKKIFGFIEQFLMTNGRNFEIAPKGYTQQNQPEPYRSAPQALTQTCPACHADIPAGSKFCPECGASTTPKTIVCPACGSELAETAKFCPECGEKLLQGIQ
jgi:hypothetical protein